MPSAQIYDWGGESYGIGMTAGVRLREMIRRAGHSLRSFARASGYKDASSVQRYVADDVRFIALNKAEKFIPALLGRGQPPITREEIYALSGVNFAEYRSVRSPELQNTHGTDDRIKISGTAPGLIYMDRDLPILGEYQGGDTYSFGDGSDVLAMTLRPSYLAEVRGSYAVYMHGDSMLPRYRAGELLFIDPVRPPLAGDDVVIQFHDGTGLIKELVSLTDKLVVSRQHNPPQETEHQRSQVRALHCIIGATRIRV